MLDVPIDMTDTKLTILVTTVPETSQRELQELLKVHHGHFGGMIGKVSLCTFQHPYQGLEMAKSAIQKIPSIGVALTRGDAAGEARNLALHLQGSARPGEILASESFISELPPPSPFEEGGHRQFQGFPAPTKVFVCKGSEAKEPDALDMFDFARVEQERALESKTVRSPEFAPMDDDRSIPLAVEPEAKKEEARQAYVPSARLMEREKRSETLKKVFLIIIVFVVVVPAIAGGLWYLIGTSQRTAVQGEQELERQLQSSDVLKAIQKKRPRGASAKQIAQGTYQRYGSIQIETIPPGATIYVDERKMGAETPFSIGKISARTPLHIRVTKAGYHDVETYLSLLPNQKKKLRFTMKRQY